MPPPNLKGGKHYKKKAKQSDQTNAILMIDRQADQQIARVIRVLGNRNMLCYCNDNKTRICHVRGKLRNRVYVELGDIVLISLRDFENEDEAEKREEVDGKKEESNRGDILAKYPYETLSKLKKEDGVNPKLFLALETLDGSRLGALGTRAEGDEGGFEFERDGEGDSGSGSESGSESDDLNVDDI